VLQSNLRRTAADLVDLARAGDDTRVRLVKGAYKEPKSVAFQRKLEVDLAYARDIESAMRSSLYPMVASHDPSMLDHTRAVAGTTQRAPSTFEMQMLYGIRTDLQDQVVNSGMQMRVYIPYGSDWYAYFMRRLAERPANVAFFLRALVRR
jgi:proline dehydrogenase